MLLLASLLLLLIRDVPEMSAVNGVSAAVDILPLPSLIGDSAVIGVPVFFMIFAVVAVFAAAGAPAIDGVLAVASFYGIFIVIL
jgi:hypothetical protein